MHALIYLSRATERFSERELPDLTRRAAEKNERLKVSGFLCYNPQKRTFFQYIEGEEREVEELMAAIAEDERHQVENLLRLGKLEERRFASWGMRLLDRAFIENIQLESVLEGVMRTLRGPRFDEATVRPIVTSLVTKIARRHRVS